MIDYTLIDSKESLSTFLKAIYNLPTSPPSLYLDLEGKDLGRDGTIEIIQVYVLPLQHTYLIDIHVLGTAAFTTPSATPSSTTTLKDILESSSIPKCIFDIRHDSDALYGLYGVTVQGVHDLQLMELATRLGNRRHVNGLTRCIVNDAGLDRAATAEFEKKKKQGMDLFLPGKGGSWDVFSERPMEPEILDYCVQDVKYLPLLWREYNGRLSAYWRGRVTSATLARVKLSKDPNFEGRGRHMALGPW